MLFCGIELLFKEVMTVPNESRYKYIGILKLDGILHRDMKDRVGDTEKV